MKISLPKPTSSAKDSDLLVACAFKSSTKQKTTNKAKNAAGSIFDACKTIKDLDKQIEGYLIDAANNEGFNAEVGQSYLTSTLGRSNAKSIALLGLGSAHDQTIDVFRKSGGEAYKLAQKKRANRLTYVVPEKTTLPLFDVVQAVAEGARLASYQFDRYQTKDKTENYVREIDFRMPSNPTPEQKTALKRAEHISTGVCAARDLINEGPMDLNPEQFAKYAKKMAEESGLAIKVMDEKALKKENMGLMLAVASAAQIFSPPRLIRLHYKPAKPSKKRVVLIGKGVTFDSGGLDIKPADGMLDMKIDMSGAAAVFGAMNAIGKIKPNVEVVGYLACVENGIGPHSYHPGDVIKSRNGLTVEIGNTDAEGRLVLADTISYALDNDKPDVVIDVATLTGACMVALGLKTAGVFANDDTLASDIIKTGETVGESYWRLPLDRGLRESIKSNIADIKNCGDRWGGSITAALFLEEFVGTEIKWAHLDIAGPATNNKPHAYLPTGGAGFGVRTLVSYVMSQN